MESYSRPIQKIIDQEEIVSQGYQKVGKLVEQAWADTL
jgi:hypothetical protein